jgi:hypothetical protein
MIVQPQNVFRFAALLQSQEVPNFVDFSVSQAYCAPVFRKNRRTLTLTEGRKSGIFGAARALSLTPRFTPNGRSHPVLPKRLQRSS